MKHVMIMLPFDVVEFGPSLFLHGLGILSGKCTEKNHGGGVTAEYADNIQCPFRRKDRESI
jgi:hypothetical protein